MASSNLPFSSEDIINEFYNNEFYNEPESVDAKEPPKKSLEELQQEALEIYNNSRKEDKDHSTRRKRSYKKPNLLAINDLKSKVNEKWRSLKSKTSEVIESFKRYSYSPIDMNTNDDRTVSTAFSSQSSDSFSKPLISEESNRQKGCLDSFKKNVSSLKHLCCRISF